MLVRSENSERNWLTFVVRGPAYTFQKRPTGPWREHTQANRSATGSRPSGWEPRAGQAYSSEEAGSIRGAPKGGQTGCATSRPEGCLSEGGRRACIASLAPPWAHTCGCSRRAQQREGEPSRKEGRSRKKPRGFSL